MGGVRGIWYFRGAPSDEKGNDKMQRTRNVLILCFLTLIVFKIYIAVSTNTHLYQSGMALLLSFIVILTDRTRIVWLLGLILFSYGLYYYLFVAVHLSSPMLMDFTAEINEYMYGSRTGQYGRMFINLVPFGFYLSGTIALLTGRVRRYYNVGFR